MNLGGHQAGALDSIEQARRRGEGDDRRGTVSRRTT